MTLDYGHAASVNGARLDDLYQAVRDVPGFSGCDIGCSPNSSQTPGSRFYRVHLSSSRITPPELIAAHDAIPTTFAGAAVQVVGASYSAQSQTRVVSDPSHIVASGTRCAGTTGGGQIGVMVVDRTSDRLGFLTSWAAVAQGGANLGWPIFPETKPDRQDRPLGYISALRLDRHGSFALCEIAPDQAWLPIVRPSGLVVNALVEPRAGEFLNVGAQRAFVEAIGIYRVVHKLGRRRARSIDMRGARILTTGLIATGALLHDPVTGMGAGLVCGTARTSGDGAVSVACFLPRVFAGLGIRMAGYDDLMDAHGSALPVRNATGIRNFLDDPRDIVTSPPRWDQPDYDAIAPNDRLDIATVLWPGLATALAGATTRKLRVSDRVEKLDPTGQACAKIALAVNGSPKLARLGVPPVKALDFAGAATFDQVCEKLNDLLERVR